MSHRLKRVEEAIRRELGAILTRNLVFKEGMVTIHDVSVAPDLRQCHIYLGVVPQGTQAKGVLRKLEENRTMLQTQLSRRVVLKYTPHLHFHLDDSIERGVRILQIMDQIPESDSDSVDDSEDDPFYDEEDPEDTADNVEDEDYEDEDEDENDGDDDDERSPRDRQPRRR